MDHLTGHAFQFRSSDSLVHRLGAGWKLALAGVMGVAAIASRWPAALGGLLLLNLLFYFAAGLKWHDLWRDTRWFLVQILIVAGLYVIRYGVQDGLWLGVQVGSRILLFFLPGAILFRTTTGSRMTECLRKVLPARLAFVISTSLRFVPLFARELGEIGRMQRLRGARIGPRQLMNPRNWNDALQSVFIPLMVRVLKTAENASLAAEARGFEGENETSGLDAAVAGSLKGRLIRKRRKEHEVADRH
ncbi:MAG: energy-coupling factor transporter transmembrane component T [Desulfatiglandaceae bacterium]|jgi:energy-coupling factor transporter transmembrane protein EcfT